ncbi:MAG: phage terminase large subunit family protein [Proteobacteria bacterium]|nr:phage terminase large subunit family protein [Pseudomonadota bacterium]
MVGEGEKQRGNVLTVTQAAALCNRSVPWVQMLAKGGYIAKEAHGKYTLVAIIRGVIAYYEDLQAKSNKASAANREESSTLSMWTSGLCSPFVTWGQRAETYMTALQSGDHDRLQTAMNASFGECYSMIASGDVPEWQEIMERRLPYKAGEVPMGGLRLVMGVDVQKFSLVGLCPTGPGCIGTSSRSP